jgi:hypothetical protein
MARGVLTVGMACALLVAGAAATACNSLSGVDGLSTDTSADSQMEPPRNDAPASSASSGHDHDPDATGTPSGNPPAADDDAGTVADAASEAGMTLPTFTDDFNRADSMLVGNGWVEKSPGKFPIVSGAVQQNQNGIYRNLFVSRPASENVHDVLVQATVTYANEMADPGIFARIQAQSAQQDQFVAYSMYPDGAADFYISRDDGNDNGADIGYVAIAPPLNPGTQYRMSLQVSGANPVHLVASITQLDGTVVVSLSTSDSSAKQITAAGSVGFGSSAASGGRVDDFKRVTLAP